MSKSADLKQEYFSPKRAAETLAKFNTRNRVMRPPVVAQYAADMRTGRWTRNTTAITFLENGGPLVTGQHRLQAVVDSGVGQWFYVDRECTPEDALNIDTGLPRSLLDNVMFSGKGLDGLSTNAIGVARAIQNGVSSTGGAIKYSHSQLQEMFTAHKEAALWALQHLPRGSRGAMGGSLLLAAAVGRAWYFEKDKDRLALFCLVVKTGVYEGNDKLAAIALRNYVQERPDAFAFRHWRDTFLKTQNAIHYFMRGTPLKVIKGITEERYPLSKK